MGIVLVPVLCIKEDPWILVGWGGGGGKRDAFAHRAVTYITYLHLNGEFFFFFSLRPLAPSQLTASDGAGQTEYSRERIAIHHNTLPRKVAVYNNIL